MQYKTFGPDAEVFGASMLAFVESINYTEFSSVLAQHGLDEINPNQWYPQQMWMDVFSDITTQQGATANLVSIGMKIAETAPIPGAEQLSLKDAMMHFNASYTGNNRGEDIGGIESKLLDEQHILLVANVPYPDDFVYGAVYGMARRFMKPDMQLIVYYDEEKPRREEGGDVTLIHVTWN